MNERVKRSIYKVWEERNLKMVEGEGRRCESTSTTDTKEKETLFTFFSLSLVSERSCRWVGGRRHEYMT